VISSSLIKGALARREIHNRTILLNLWVLKTFFGGRPVPLPYWVLLRSIAGATYDDNDPLFPAHAFERTKGSEIGITELSRIFENDLVGLWTLDKATIRFLWSRLFRERPCVIIECGAGLSTLMLGTYSKLIESRFRHRTAVLSLEQDQEVATEIQERLRECRLDDYVHVFFAPLSDEGRYTPDASALSQHLGEQKADWLLIDGPAGPEGCRQWTIPTLSRFCRPFTKWFLDDAFRDGEIRVLRAWSRSKGIEVQGIYPFGKGLGTGVISKPEAVKEDLNYSRSPR
jgi:hypothetical protein